MSTPVKYTLIGFAVTLIAIVGLFVAVGPRDVLASILFSLSNDTEFAPGYSDKAYDKIKIGNPKSAVISAVGQPISEYETEAYTKITFASGPTPEFGEEGLVRADVDYTTFTFSDDGTLKSVFGRNFVARSGGGLSAVTVTYQMGDGQNFLGIKKSEVEALKEARVTRAVIEAKYGKPTDFYESNVVRKLVYSRSPGSNNYQRCWIGLDSDDNVLEITNEIYWD